MNACTILLVVITLCYIAVDGRHHDKINVDVSEHGDAQIEDDSGREHINQMRHRRKRWNTGYGLRYQPQSPFYADDRRDQDLYPQILRLLEEIESYVRRPPPPPQPIYVPYPVVYPPPPKRCNCKISYVEKPTSDTPNVTNRFLFDDISRNWGLQVIEEEDYEDGSDGSRPISFDPIEPIRTNGRRPPAVDHGSEQAGEEKTTKAPKFDRETLSSVAPGICNAAILSCCHLPEGPQQQRKCFINLGCSMTYANGKACTRDSVSKVLQDFTRSYSPQ